MSSTVLVTGVSSYLGARFAREAAASPEVDRVIGIDTLAPRHPLGGAEFVRADLRNPIIGRILDQAGVDAVVHLGLNDEANRAGAARVSQKEHNVIGTMHLLAAVQAQRTVRRVVFASTAEVYGSSPRDPVAFRESSAVAGGARTGWVRDAVEVEGFVRALERRRPDVTTCILRLTHVVGGHVDGTVTQYLRGRVVPVPLGYDARLQLLHEQDAVTALQRATLSSVSGTVNVAADGVVPLSQALRLTHCVGVPVLLPAGRLLGGFARRSRLSDLSDEQIDYLVWGRVLDTTRMRDDLGLEPAMTTRQTLLDFARVLGRAPHVGDGRDVPGSDGSAGGGASGAPTSPAAPSGPVESAESAPASVPPEVSTQPITDAHDERASA